MLIEQTYHLSGYGDIVVSRDATDDVVTVNITTETNRIQLQFWAEEVQEFIDVLNEVRVAPVEHLDDVTSAVPVELTFEPHSIEEPEDYQVQGITVFPTIPVEIPYEVIEDTVQQFIDTETPFVIDYTKEDGEEVTRVVSPYEINEVQDHSPFSAPKYVRGYDHQRQDIRSFRLTRIRGIAPASEEFIGSISNPI